MKNLKCVETRETSMWDTSSLLRVKKGEKENHAIQTMTAGTRTLICSVGES